MPPEPHGRTQEQSIKARKHQLFEVESVEKRPISRTFQDCLRETPADPLSTPIKALIWVVGTVVVLLLVAAFATGGNRKPRPKPTTAAPSVTRAA